MRKRLVTRYTVTIKYTPTSQPLVVWGTCLGWLKEFNLARYTATEFSVKTERVMWFGDSPLCSALTHNH